LKEGAKRAQRIFLTRPMSAEERLTKSIRFLEANDGRLPELRPQSIYMDFITLHNLDIFGILFAALLISLGLFLWIFSKVMSLVRGGKISKTKKE
jgi:hypothetical protein